MLVQKFEELDRMLTHIFSYYNTTRSEYVFAALPGNTQNSLPKYFLEYAIFKQEVHHNPSLPGIWEEAIDNFAATFDDYQYLILLNWFLCDYYTTEGNLEKSGEYFNSALELSRFASYDFYIAFLLKNDPLKREEHLRLADQMISESGFNRERFTYGFGPSASQ